MIIDVKFDFIKIFKKINVLKKKRLPLVEEPLGQHDSSYRQSFSVRWLGPEEEVLVLPQTDSLMVVVGIGPGGHSFGLGTECMLVHTHIHRSGISDTDTCILSFVCPNIERLLSIVSMTKNQILYGFQWNYVLAE